MIVLLRNALGFCEPEDPLLLLVSGIVAFSSGLSLHCGLVFCTLCCKLILLTLYWRHSLCRVFLSQRVCHFRALAIPKEERGEQLSGRVKQAMD